MRLRICGKCRRPSKGRSAFRRVAGRFAESGVAAVTMSISDASVALECPRGTRSRAPGPRGLNGASHSPDAAGWLAVRAPGRRRTVRFEFRTVSLWPLCKDCRQKAAVILSNGPARHEARPPAQSISRQSNRVKLLPWRCGSPLIGVDALAIVTQHTRWPLRSGSLSAPTEQLQQTRTINIVADSTLLWAQRVHMVLPGTAIDRFEVRPDSPLPPAKPASVACIS